MSFVRIKKDGGVLGISRAIGKVVPATRGGDMFTVSRGHLEYHGAFPFDSVSTEFSFKHGRDCEQVGIATAFISWLTNGRL